uniref:Uncharacterized protein n=1 Tax=Setaria viridis TaxID=4556 RepID=A0A4U6TK30_SETVI|nr:hypothetical protein SEVIR_7G035358v2 [Setaria viridis]
MAFGALVASRMARSSCTLASTGTQWPERRQRKQRTGSRQSATRWQVLRQTKNLPRIFWRKACRAVETWSPWVDVGRFGWSECVVLLCIASWWRLERWCRCTQLQLLSGAWMWPWR